MMREELDWVNWDNTELVEIVLQFETHLQDSYAVHVPPKLRFNDVFSHGFGIDSMQYHIYIGDEELDLNKKVVYYKKKIAAGPILLRAEPIPKFSPGERKLTATMSSTSEPSYLPKTPNPTGFVSEYTR